MVYVVNLIQISIIVSVFFKDLLVSSVMKKLLEEEISTFFQPTVGSWRIRRCQLDALGWFTFQADGVKSKLIEVW